MRNLPPPPLLGREGRDCAVKRMRTPLLFGKRRGRGLSSAITIQVSNNDFALPPSLAGGRLGKYYQLFKDEYENILYEPNEALALQAAQSKST